MMIGRYRWAAFLVAGFALAVSLKAFGQAAKPNLQPVVAETPWGQHVVPQLATYLDIEVYKQLKPGQRWSEGDSIRKRLTDEYKSGKLKLRHFPWRVLEGLFVLGRDDQGQLIYLLDTGEGLLLIDPSYDSWQEILDKEIRELDFELSDVKWVLLTHCHVDHAQSCLTWRARGAKIYAGAADAHPVETANDITAWWLVDEPDRHFTPSPVDEKVYDGDRLHFGPVTLYAIATPGHTPGATCYYLYCGGKHILFSGDIALHNGRHAWMGNPYANWGQYFHSLEKLAHYALEGKEIEFDILLPGHGTIDLDWGMRSVRETVRVVRNIVARRKSGENIDWIDPYPWNWQQGVVYAKGR